MVKVELTDIVFAIDSILVAVAMSPKLWVIITGGLLGIVAMRMVIGQLLAIVRRYPALVDGAFVIIAWVGIKLLIEYAHSLGWVHFLVPKWLSLGVIVVIFTASFFYARTADAAAGRRRDRRRGQRAHQRSDGERGRYEVSHMARGWESKSVESQQADSWGGGRPARPVARGARPRRARAMRSTLALARVRDELAGATQPAHRAMLERAIAATGGGRSAGFPAEGQCPSVTVAGRDGGQPGQRAARSWRACPRSARG